jgi:SAM-dependent methyltransferase
MGLYANFIAPWLVDCACGTKPIAYQRRKIIPRATGVVLEIGAGGGRNFALYDREKVERLIALEPDAAMVKRGRARAPEGLPLEWLQRGAENAGVADGSVDTIVTTYTLCTIPDAVGALAALKRTLKPESSTAASCARAANGARPARPATSAATPKGEPRDKRRMKPLSAEH